MKTKLLPIALTALFFSAFSMNSAHAAKEWISDTTIDSISIIPNGYQGGCRIQPNISPKDITGLETCKEYLTLDCTTRFSEAITAQRMLDMATAGQVLGKTFDIKVDSSKKIDGACQVIILEMN